MGFNENMQIKLVLLKYKSVFAFLLNNRKRKLNYHNFFKNITTFIAKTLFA